MAVTIDTKRIASRERMSLLARERGQVAKCVVEGLNKLVGKETFVSYPDEFSINDEISKKRGWSFIAVYPPAPDSRAYRVFCPEGDSHGRKCTGIVEDALKQTRACDDLHINITVGNGLSGRHDYSDWIMKQKLRAVKRTPRKEKTIRREVNGVMRDIKVPVKNTRPKRR